MLPPEVTVACSPLRRGSGPRVREVQLGAWRASCLPHAALQQQHVDTHLALGEAFRYLGRPVPSSAAAIEHPLWRVNGREYESAIKDSAQHRMHQLQSRNLVLPRSVSTRGVSTARVGRHGTGQPRQWARSICRLPRRTFEMSDRKSQPSPRGTRREGLFRPFKAVSWARPAAFGGRGASPDSCSMSSPRRCGYGFLLSCQTAGTQESRAVHGSELDGEGVAMALSRPTMHLVRPRLAVWYPRGGPSPSKQAPLLLPEWFDNAVSRLSQIW